MLSYIYILLCELVTSSDQQAFAWKIQLELKVCLHTITGCPTKYFLLGLLMVVRFKVNFINLFYIGCLSVTYTYLIGLLVCHLTSLLTLMRLTHSSQTTYLHISYDAGLSITCFEWTCLCQYMATSQLQLDILGEWSKTIFLDHFATHVMLPGMESNSRLRG